MSDLKFEVSLDLIEEMAECIYDCSWASSEEIAAYMKSCITNSDSYEPEQWSEKGKGVKPIERNIIDLKKDKE